MRISYFRFELTGREVLWAIKHDSIGNHYFDKGAATFLLSHLESTNTPSAKEPVTKRMKYGIVEKELSQISLKGILKTILSSLKYL